MTARDDDVDLAGPGLHAFADFCDAQVPRRQASRKAGGHGGHRNTGAFQCADGGFDHVMIDADRAYGQARHPQLFQHLGPHRLAGFGAEALHAPGSVIARQRGQVDQGNRFQKPSRLKLFLHRTPPAKRAAAPLDCRSVGLHPRDPVKVKLHPRIADMSQLRQQVRGGFGFGLHCCRLDGLRDWFSACHAPGFGVQ